MTASTPRLRMFAGPNGSGKSTINEVLPPQLLGIYVNADEMEKAIRVHGFLDLAPFQPRLKVAETSQGHIPPSLSIRIILLSF